MIIILGILAIATVGYTVMVGNVDNTLLVSENSVEENSVLQNELLALLLDIRLIRLNESILSDPVFQGLEDFGQDIIPEPIGRKNPFAPVDPSELQVNTTE